jgi:hypothetical protein
MIAGSGGALRNASFVGLRGKACAGLAKEAGGFATAEADLLEAQSVVAKLRGEKEAGEWTQGLVDLYAAWDSAEPGKVYDAKAEAWKTKLPTKATTRPREKK